MPFVLHPYAAVVNGYVTRFLDDPSEVQGDEVALPVVADEDPVLGEDERVWGPDFEVLEDRVRAYGRPVRLDTEEILQKRIQRLEALIAQLDAKVV